MKNKDKYDLTKLTFKIEGENNPSQVFKILDGANVVFEKPILLNRAHLSIFLSWLEEEYDPKILTDKEKAYLSAVIKPFRKDIKYITKKDFVIKAKEYLLIKMHDLSTAGLPLFEKETMYKGMEVDKKYTLEKLGL
ncbi:hypothetical protein [Solobacterium moorei]|uniref:hypothetical protein n=1 Tax=Solobacterium moorei TaxID=102148 RepID=UPI0023F0ED77|nr:hypothetical protein [Solobacterium moorei]